MSTPKIPDQAKLIMSLFMNDQTILEALLPMLQEKYGEIDIISPWFDFDYTDYYYREMGSPLFRRVVVFKELIEQEELGLIKICTNELELMWTNDGNRNLNIDPGYLLPSRFILATGKDYSHRIYIGNGIYADLTLIYTKGGFKSLEWTYPDYAGDAIKGFLETVREKYCIDLKRKRKE